MSEIQYKPLKSVNFAKYYLESVLLNDKETKSMN